MPKIIILLVISLLLPQCIYGQNFKGNTENFEIQPAGQTLCIGETLDYSVEWLGIPVGYAVLKIEGKEMVNGHECYHLSAVAKPNNFLKKIIDLEYQVHSYFDTRLLATRKFEKLRIMNKKTIQATYEFNLENGTVISRTKGDAPSYRISSSRSKLKKEKSATNKIPPHTQDLLSAFYYFRLLDIKGDSSYSLNIYYESRNWDFYFKVSKPYLKDIHKRGTFVIFDVTPESQLNDFILGKSRFQVKYNADPSRIPVEFKFGTGIGSISAKIQDIPSCQNGKI